jgi:hypothetical protein
MVVERAEFSSDDHQQPKTNYQPSTINPIGSQHPDPNWGPTD